jgi:hypothetical protein
MRWAIRLTALLLSIEAMAAGLRPGYLATLGPSALRFQQPPAQKPTAAVLPPLPAAETIPAAAVTSQASVPAPSVIQEMHRSTNDTVAVQSPPSLTLPLLPETTNDVLVTPQMLLEFFRQKTGRETSVVLPLNFIPPQTSYRPSSTASYDSP